MKITPEIMSQVVARVVGKFKDRKVPPCPLCGQRAWEIQNLYTIVPALEEPQNLVLGGPNFPFVLFVCTICGNTHFLNIKVLGLEHLLVADPPHAAAEKPEGNK